jgi:zinc transport system substrate-binding protein
LVVLIGVMSCGHDPSGPEKDIITVSIAPFKYFVEEIAGGDFSVNIMVPPGANPHIYEPYPDQINKLRRSEAYISNGYLGFEDAWLPRFYEINDSMIKLSLGANINPIISKHEHDGKRIEGPDPHYWVSPKCAYVMATSVKDLLCTLKPIEKKAYESNYEILIAKIRSADSLAEALFSRDENRSFMIYHPNLAYLARDYNLSEVAVEFEGKEPPPSRLKELIDLAKTENIKTIFIQKEFDSRNAKTIAKEIGADVTVINPLSEDWLASTMEIINGLHKSFTEN